MMEDGGLRPSVKFLTFLEDAEETDKELSLETCCNGFDTLIP